MSVLWILGAGASHHLGMPLLNGFPSFFRDLWERFPENKKDPELAATLPEAIRLLDLHPSKNIEELLAIDSPLGDAAKTLLKRAIRRGFERRNLGRILKVFGKTGKLGPYCRLLGLMEAGDEVISFNYDNALEIPLCLASHDFAALNVSELDSAQMRYLTNGEAGDRWIPPDCEGLLRLRALEYSPRAAFVAGTRTIVGSGALRIPFIKIHGSVNWFEGHGSIHIGTPSDRRMPPLIVYPEGTKPELLREPCQAILREAIDALSRCSSVAIVGYSFPPSDATGHPFVSQLASIAATKKMLAVDPYPKDKLVEVVGSGQIIQATFEESVQPDAKGQNLLATEIEKMRSS
jgi:hypothetical protein